MLSLNLHDVKPYHVDEIQIESNETYELIENISSTNLNHSVHIEDSWNLKNAFIIQNKSFEREFNEKRDEIRERAYYSDNWDVRFGFLATNNNGLIDKLAEEGLEIKMRPYNYLGHCTSGVHISMNADVCLNEARNKFNSEEITLIVFKYMLGKRKMVPMYDPKVLLAPTPNFDSHVCEERPIPNEKHAIQYIKSLVYLYEFSDELYDPVIRPKHCVPIGALIFESLAPSEILDLTESESLDTPFHAINSFMSNSKNPRLPKPPWSEAYSKFNNEGNFKRAAIYNQNKSIKQSKNSTNFLQKISDSEQWRPINYGDVFNQSVGESLILKPQGRERLVDRVGMWKDNKAERTNKWKTGISLYGGQKYNQLMSNKPL